MAATNRVTRRQLAALLAAVPVSAQTQATRLGPEEELKRQIESVRGDSRKLADFAVPMPVEPAFQFRA